MAARPRLRAHLQPDGRRRTAEISRAQLWQWNRYGSHTDDGQLIDSARIKATLAKVLEEKRASMGEAAYNASKFERAGELLLQFTEGEFRSFLTTDLYSELM